MRVKIRDNFFDSTKEPVMLIMSEEEKKLISQMAPEHFVFCTYPDGTPEEMIQEWMKNKGEEK